MSISVEGLYRNGKVELLAPVTEPDGSRVMVTWLPTQGPVDLQDRKIDDTQAADLRPRLSTFSEDWDRPEMSVYDGLSTG